LFEHHLFENLGERVAAGIGHMRRIFGYRSLAAIMEMSNPRIAADQNELPSRGTLAEFFEQPEQPFHSDVDHIVRRLLAGCQMKDVSDVLHCLRDGLAIGNRSSHDGKPVVFQQSTVVAKSLHACMPPAAV
jgi:hypothetical protein